MAAARAVVRASLRRSASRGRRANSRAAETASTQGCAGRCRRSRRAAHRWPLRATASEFAASYRRHARPYLRDGGLRIDLGGRVDELKHLGRGNTGGDVVAWLPAERILVAGDLVDHPVPYAFAGYPTEWIATLDVSRSIRCSSCPGTASAARQGLHRTRRRAAAQPAPAGQRPARKERRRLRARGRAEGDRPERGAKRFRRRRRRQPRVLRRLDGEPDPDLARRAQGALSRGASGRVGAQRDVGAGGRAALAAALAAPTTGTRAA